MRKRTQEFNRMSNGIETIETERSTYEQKRSRRNEDTDMMIFVLIFLGMMMLFMIILFKF